MVQKKTFKQRIAGLRDSYRLIIRNTETFQDVGVYNLSILNIYVICCVILMILGVFVFFLLGYTPLKRMLPNYGKETTFKEAYQLNQKLNTLETKLAAQDLYIRQFKNLLSGNIDTSYAKYTNRDSLNPENIPFASRIVEDEWLRLKIDLDPNNQTQTYTPKLQKNLDVIYFVPPLKGILSAGYDQKINHLGVDIGAAKNSPIRCIKNGVVIFADWTLETGYTVAIQHSTNLISFYKHNSAILKKVGEKVNSGEVIAIIGNSGTLSSGPHLHFEIWHDGKPLNPLDYIEY